MHITNAVDKTQLSRSTSHRRSTKVSLETYPSILEDVQRRRTTLTFVEAETEQN